MEAAFMTIYRCLTAVFTARGVFFCALITALLVASSSQADSLSSYYSWRWGGFSRGDSSGGSPLSAASAAAASSAAASVSTLSGVVSASYGNASLSGVIYYDVNADNVRESTDWAVFNASVTLSGTSTTSNGTTTHTATYTLTDITGTKGIYSFTGLAAGTYSVTLNSISNTGGSVSVGTGAANSVGIVASEFSMSNIVLKDTSAAVDFDFAEYSYPVTALTKQIFMDSNRYEHTDVVPEPGTLILSSIALALVGFFARRKMRRA
jgi:hypothetical protein